MAKNHIQQGAVIPWTNDTGSDVSSGDVVDLPDMIGVATVNIADTEEGQIATEDVWELPKQAALAIDIGDQVYWDAAAGEIDKTNTNTAAGKCAKSALAGDATVYVKINA